jgi:ribosomal protein S18 acetylase RimI-like enzyme
MRLEIRRAVSTDAARATEIARVAKAHWGYPAEWLEQWEDDLSFSPEEIAKHPTFVATVDGDAVGVCQLQEGDVGAVLDHVWVDPACHGRGIGRALVEHALSVSQGVIAVIADPNAERFYIKLGATRVAEVDAPMPGAPDRKLPLLEWVR